jgi:hypothetical protein
VKKDAGGGGKKKGGGKTVTSFFQISIGRSYEGIVLH